MGALEGRARSLRTRPATNRMAGILAAVALAGCQLGPTAAPATPSPVAIAPPSVATPGATVQPTSEPTPRATIPQPPVTGVKVHPDADRVDLAMPVFSHPTQVTNPYFPVSSQASVLMLGHVDGKPFRTEVTLLPDTRVIDWAGQRVEVLVSQYVAFLDGQIQEVAYDLYAQDDDGNVWYFGEDVFDFADGVIIETEGTWQAGRDGPAAMIMPAHPKVGDVYRTENVPGLVFEEVTVQATDARLDGPLGPISGGLVAQELHMDGATEGKTFAPGYGEFYTADGHDVEALAMAVPTDFAGGTVPDDLATVVDDALRIEAAAATGSWQAAAAALATARPAWDRFVATGAVPRLVEPLASQALRSLSAAVGAHRAAAARQAAINLGRLLYDVELRYRPPTDVDQARFGLWLLQLQLDASARNGARVRSDYFSLDYARDRIAASLSPDVNLQLNQRMGDLLIAIDDGNLSRAGKLASELRPLLGS